MNIFFYAASAAKCRERCSYETCNRKCLALLNKVPVLSHMFIIPAGSKLQTPTSMELRSGDILILYAGDEDDLADLLKLRGYIDNFRIILIVGKEDLMQAQKHHSLMPRYTTTMTQNIEKLGAVINRMSAQQQYSALADSLPQGQYHG